MPEQDVTLPDEGFETLRNARSFRRVLRDGARSNHGGIVVVGAPGPSSHARLGLVVSRRCGNAVTRNRIKRRLRHAAGALRLQPGNDYVIIASSRVAEATYPEIVDWIRLGVEELEDA